MNGSGTAESPWEITTAQEFVSITSSDVGYYKLMNNLDCSDVVFDEDFKLYQSNLNLNGKKIECFYYNKDIPFEQSTIHDGQIIKIIDADDSHEFSRDCQFNKVSMYFKLRSQRNMRLAYETGFYQCNININGGIVRGYELFRNSSTNKAKISNSKINLNVSHDGSGNGVVIKQIMEYSYFTGTITTINRSYQCFWGNPVSCIFDITTDNLIYIISTSETFGTIYNHDKYPYDIYYVTPVTTDQLKSYTALTSPEINFDVEEVT